jgi:hypothetical protein
VTTQPDGATPAHSDLGWLGGLALAALAFPCSLLLVDGYRFPLGPDVPVYLWWIRLGGAEGVSIVGARAGSVAALIATGSTLRLSPANAVGGLSVALGAAIALAAAALLRSSGASRTTWLLAGALTGTFAIYIVAGYLATAAAVAPFIAAAAMIAQRTRRSTIAAALLLGAAGLAHPVFFLIDAVVLAAAAAWSAIEGERGRGSDLGAIGAALLGGAAILVVGTIARALGPAPPDVDTSRDAFLRRAGFLDSLRSSYVERFAEVWQRYAPWASVPLAAVGLPWIRGFHRRFLGSWAGVTLVGVLLAFASRRLPPSRFATYGMALPILAGVGAVWLWRTRRTPFRALAAVLVASMLGGAVVGLTSQVPFVSPLEAARAETAARIAETLPPGTPLVFVVDANDAPASFLATRAGNVLRAAVSPNRARDVYVYVGRPGALLDGRPTLGRGQEHDVLSRTYLALIPRHPSPVAIVLAPFDRTAGWRADGLYRWARGVYASVPGSLAVAPPATDPLRPSSPVAMTLSSLVVLAVLAIVGYGWARAVVRDAIDAAALAPAFGVAAIVLVATAFDRIGLRLGTWWIGFAASAVAGLGGYVIWLVDQRTSRADATPPVPQEPAG